MKRGYVDGRYGQVHYWEHGASGTLPDLYCLHATAYSGQTLLPLLERLGRDRRVIALDTPGYGGSDAPPAPIPFEAYGLAIAEAIRAARGAASAPVDLFGYHTGALLATEVAAADAALVARLVLIGVPFFSAEENAAWRDKLVHKSVLTESFDQFRARWDYFITNRTPGLPLRRAFDCFVDELRVYPRDWWAHGALMDYRADLRLPLASAPALVINPRGSLEQQSRNAARAMPRCTLVELPQVGGAPFDLAPDALADAMREFLTATA
ncbi:alpha/beta fold hydrolase [Duganella sp. BuS-21]|uniref:alpha/beta fold hydrolase n=1 Tax=Duganella sp. BuS-21 TaxID=2943848 RepID=UPI0035A64D48